MWKKLGKEGFAIKAAWPVADEEDRLLTRQGKFLRDSLKKFRAQAGKAKKGVKTATIVVSDNYPQWKIDTLQWLQSQYDADTNDFHPTFMKDLKVWTGEKFAGDKKMIKFAMQFSSFTKNEAKEVGAAALEIQMPFDQASILEGSITYLKSQLNLPELNIIKLEKDEATEVPDRIAEQVTPGKAYLWMR
jgi:leucyl-tRNA synthetase